MDPAFNHLRQLLHKRLTVIADHAWRDRAPAAHLAELQSVSEALMAEHARLRGQLPPRLNHFLTQASYAKALDYLETGTEG